MGNDPNKGEQYPAKALGCKLGGWWDKKSDLESECLSEL